MAFTLEQELEQLDDQIAGIRAQREASHDDAERAQLQRSITSLNIHERAAIKQNHAERDALRAAEEKAADDFQRQRAAAQEAEHRQMLRRRWPGDDQSFDAAWPELIRQYRIDVALGRDVGADISASRVAF
jgi:chromosome segregation ATPase